MISFHSPQSAFPHLVWPVDPKFCATSPAACGAILQKCFAFAFPESLWRKPRVSVSAHWRGAHVPSLVCRAGNVTRTLVARPVPRLVRRPRIERHRARVSRAGSGRGAAFENPPPPAMEAPRTVEDVADNFQNRREGLIKALTTGKRPARAPASRPTSKPP